MIEIVVADDHVLTREGLKNRMKQEAIDMKIINEASTAAELLKKIDEKNPNVVILDITLPDRNGLDVLKEIKANYPKMKVIVLSMHPEERYAVRAYKAGASAYLSKDRKNLSAELIQAIRLIVTQNRRYVTKEVASELAEYLHKTNVKNHQELSDREFQVFCLIALGNTTKEIARELSITVQTVYTYRNRAKEKLDLETDADFTRHAIQHNLID